MRLLTNIRNEYAVFAGRLITERRGIESLQADQLFALVVYKNIHLADFERVMLGRSSLDNVYRLSRELVTESISVRRARLRRIADEVALPKALAKKAGEWGERLRWYVDSLGRTKNARYSVTTYSIGGTAFDPGQVGTQAFWLELIAAGNGVVAKLERSGYGDENLQVAMDDIRRLFEGGLPVDAWETVERAELVRERARLQTELETLRTADFKELAKRDDFTLTLEDEPIPFKTLLERHINSEVGRALIADGFIDRYYTLYVAQYYGDRVPPNAMNFIVQNVDTNTTDVNYLFNDDAEIGAVLRETNRSFLSDVSAYNIGILDYLLAQVDPGACIVLDAIIRHVGEAEQAFLGAYLGEGVHAVGAIAYVAGRWPAVFTQLIKEVDIAHETRLELVDVALANSNPKVDYELDDAVRTFLQSNYKSLPTLAMQATDGTDNTVDAANRMGADVEEDAARVAAVHGQTLNAVVTMKRSGFVCDDLAALNPTAIRLVVEHDCYTLTAANLRSALGAPATLSLDRIREIDRCVYKDVLEKPDEYLAAIAIDMEVEDGAGSDASLRARTRTPWTVEEPGAFAGVVIDLENCSEEHAFEVIFRAHPDCVIDDLTTVPSTSWENLARAQRFPASLLNVDAHIRHVGELNADLAAILMAAGAIAASAPDEFPTSDDDSADIDQVTSAKVRVAEAILTASNAIPDAALRVKLVRSLELDGPFPVASVQPESGPLLGLLIAEGVCDDEPTLFAHFAGADWATLRYAIGQSAGFAEFMTPQLVDATTTPQLLESDDIKPDVKQALLKRFDEFIDPGNSAALSAAGRAALAMDAHLAVGNVASIASGTRDADLVVRLLHHAGDAINVAETVEILRLLAPPYNELANAGARLTFPRDDHHAAVLRRLHEDGRIAARAQRKSLMKPARIDVTVK